MEGKGILLHKHSVALVDGEAKSPDPSILRYGEIAINYATDHETISFKNQNDEIATFKTHKLYTQLLGDKQDKTDESLTTQDKTIVGALNELKTDLDDSVEPYVVNLTNLLSANDSESISAAIGGIQNLNSTISRNQVIFGVLATGTVAVGIRVFGNQTTLNYFVDSVLGLTINEITITNTDNTLSKTVETHAVLTENMVINSLTSDETTLPLSAAQGKALNEKILNSGKVYVIDGSLLNEENPTSEQISEAIGGWDNLYNAILNNNVIVLKFAKSGVSQFCVAIVAMIVDPYAEIQVWDMGGETLNVFGFTKQSDEISLYKTHSIHFASPQDITDAINALDSSGQTADIGEVISYVSQENGIVTVGKKTLSSDDIPTLPQSKITDLSTDLAAKQNATDNTLDTEDKTIVGAINEILPKATGVGKIDPSSDGTGEVFNDYTNNKATNSFAHAEGGSTRASGAFAHAEGNDTEASGTSAHAEGGSTIASGAYAHAEGHHNFDDSSAIHMVGIGTSNTDRKNAHVIKREDGSHYIIGIGGYEGQATDSAQSLQEVINSIKATVIDVSTLFADSATITSELSSEIAAYGESTATDFPLMYAGASIGNIKPTWIRTSAGVTNMMCIADNKIWYFEIQGTTVQRASLSIS